MAATSPTWRRITPRAMIRRMVQFGTVPDWLAAVGTVGSLGLLAVGLLREIRLRREDDERAAAERRDAEADLARLITVDFGWRDGNITFVIRNDSPSPIRHLRIALCVQRDDGVERIPLELFGFAGTPNTVGAHDTRTVQCGMPETVDDATPKDDIDAETDFVDGYGRRWRYVSNSDSLLRVQDGAAVPLS
jgi:hypothetical protein